MPPDLMYSTNNATVSLASSTFVPMIPVEPRLIQPVTKRLFSPTTFLVHIVHNAPSVVKQPGLLLRPLKRHSPVPDAYKAGNDSLMFVSNDF